MEILSDLIQLAAFLISFAYLYGRAYRWLPKRSKIQTLFLNGIIFGLMGTILSTAPIELSEGLVLDTRVIIIAYAGIFSGLWTSLIAGAICCVFRFFTGDFTYLSSLIIMLPSVVLGFAGKRFYYKEREWHSKILFLITGVISAFIVLAGFFFIEKGGEAGHFQPGVASFFIMYTLMGYLVGFLISREERQIHIEDDLARGIERQRKALQVANDGYFDWNMKEEKFFLDSNYYLQAGYEPGDFPGGLDEWKKRVYPQDLNKVISLVESFIEGEGEKYKAEYRFRRKDGSWMWILSRAVALDRDGEGRVKRLLGTHSDITDYKEAQQELKQFQSAIDQAAESIMITDAEGNIQYVNPSFTRITGYERGDVLGKKPSLLSSGTHDREFFRDLWDTISSGQSWKGRIKNKKKDGGFYIAESLISPVYGEDNIKIVNYVSINRDITRNLNLQEQVVHSQKMQALGELAGGVAHDFNNMLTGIMTATLMLRKKNGLDEKSLKYLSIIDEAVQRSADLTQNLLSYSRKQPQKLNIIDLHETVGKTVKLLRSTLDKSVSLKIDLCGELSSIIGDAAQIENALLNLCINASHAIAGNGEITISSEIVMFDTEYCHSDPFELIPGEYIHLAVKDTGSGIDAEHLDKIFDPFFTTKAKSEGTGLGLTGVYAMIQQHNGSISVESAIGRGTVFHLYFYRVIEEKIVEEPAEAPVNQENVEGRILLVDDEVLIRGPLKDMLSDAGYSVLVAENGMEALQIFRDEMDNIDLVILDVVMPAMDGLQCLSGLREMNPEIPVIVETGYISEDKIAKMREIGIQGLIKKPASEEMIKSNIAEVLSGR